MNNRRAKLAKIHIAKKELSFGDEQYQAILLERMGVESAGELDDRGLDQLVAILTDMGWTPKRSKKTGTLPAGKAQQIKRIWAQCYSLGRPVPGYADGMASQMFKVAKVQWLNNDQLRSVSAALAYQQQREGAATQ